MSKTHELHVSSGLSLGSTSTARVTKNLIMTAEAEEFLEELAERSGLSEGNVLRLALGMFKCAIDAKEEGKHFGVASSPDVLDTELVGF